MSGIAKVFVTVVILVMIFIPGIGELVAIPGLAALGYIWSFAPTTS